MSRIIKSGNATGIASLHSLGAAPPAAFVAVSAQEEERQAASQRIALLEAELRQRDAEAADLRAEIDRAREDEREEGYEAGLAAAEDRQSERLQLLESAMTRAHATLEENMQSLIRLAPLLAQDCLDLILGDASDHAERIARIAEKQLAGLERSMLVGIRLSRLDFPDDAALSALSGRLGLAPLQLGADEDIPPGGCTMVMQLGRIHVGLDQQWPVLRGLLDEMALPEAAP